jgi:hypothetical protein
MRIDWEVAGLLAVLAGLTILLLMVLGIPLLRP